MKRRAVFPVLAAAAASAAPPDNQWPTPFAKAFRDSFIEHWKDTREYSLAVLDAMPPEGYTSKPNPAQMSFGEQMRHHGAANVVYFNAFGLLPLPEILKTTRETMNQLVPADNKAAVRKYVEASFDYVLAVLDKLSERDLTRTHEMWKGAPPHSGTDIFLRAYTHTAHHRGQAVVYLRVQGIKPPTWKFEPAAG